MERFSQLMLEVWREACRQVRIEVVMERTASVLVRRLPFDRLLLRRLDSQRGLAETLADWPGGDVMKPLPARTSCSVEDGLRLGAWVWQGALVQGPAQEIHSTHPGLLPKGLGGEVLAGGLASKEGPTGILILQSASRIFTAEHAEICRAVLEPVAVALENEKRVRELSVLREAAEADRRSLLSRLGRQDITDTLVGADSGLREVMEKVELVARSDAPVLILGETGSGKEVVARAIHSRSRRTKGPFLRVNCGAIPSELIDSELFGHERGSFTGAVDQHKGWFERADRGSLFLDEIGELSPAAQVRLLRVLQDGSFQRVGGQQTLSVDVRVVAATNQDLHAMVAEGRFREDLWYRIAVFPIRLPALRERQEDIPTLATHFALRAANRLGLAPQVPSLADMALLVAYPWPGNVRELAAVMERAAILGDGRRLEVAKALGGDLSAPSGLKAANPAISGEREAGFPSLDQAQRKHIEAALQRTRGRIEGPFGAARLLEINPHTLRARMRKLGMDWSRFR